MAVIIFDTLCYDLHKNTRFHNKIIYIYELLLCHSYIRPLSDKKQGHTESCPQIYS